jgi:hypothetical protein
LTLQLELQRRTPDGIVKLDLAPDMLEMRVVRYANDKELHYAVNVNRSASLALFARAHDMAAGPREE